MDNVIRPSFGARPRSPSSEAPVYEGSYQPLHVYGQAAGHLVALIEDASGPEGLVLKVVVGPAAGNSIEAVAFFLASDEGRIDADATANAILRALEVVEGGGGFEPA